MSRQPNVITRVLKNGRRIRGDVTTKAGSDRRVRMVWKMEEGDANQGVQVALKLEKSRKQILW